MKIYQFSKLILLALFSLLLFVPVTAQEVVEQEDDLIEDLETYELEIPFSGYVHFGEDGTVYLYYGEMGEDGTMMEPDKLYYLAPAGVIAPSLLGEGQFVEVDGSFLNDDTFKLNGITVYCDENGLPEGCVEEPVYCDESGLPEGCVEPPAEEPVYCDESGLPEGCVEPPAEEPVYCDESGLPEGCVEPPADDDTGDEEPECTPDGHPVAARIADAFDVSACEVEALHDAGNGFGNIAKAYLLAEAANEAMLEELGLTPEDLEGMTEEELAALGLLDAQSYVDMHKSGTGWGNIMKESNLHPSDLAPGQLKKRANSDDDTEEVTDETSESFQSASSNNGKGKNKVKSNNGNGNGNANANANNGNGNGNANANANNGNGNGNGKDKNKGKGKGKKK